MVGAGVSGLTTALMLAEAGVRVQVLADRPPHLTTSADAGAVWGPYAVNDPRVLVWSMRTLRRMRRCAEDKESGVRFLDGLEAAQVPAEPPVWASFLPGFRRAAESELPSGFVSGWRYLTPVLDMPIYLAYLVERLDDLGVAIDTGMHLASLDDVAERAGVVVNCSGLGARELVADDELEPVMGLLVVVENPGIEGFFSDYPECQEPTYFMSQGDHVILGGTIVPPGTEPKPDAEAARLIIERCASVEPLLAEARVLKYRVNARPSRPFVRLERESLNGRTVIHNYGHGGSGVTLSWGCAQDVLALLD